MLPAPCEIGEELELHSPFEVDPVTNQPLPAAAG